MCIAVCILLGILITLDQHAVRAGKRGIFEVMSGDRPVSDSFEVEKTYLQVLSGFEIQRRHLKHIGTVPDKNERILQHRVMVVDSADSWLEMFRDLEVDLERAGITVHSRFAMKTQKLWKYTLFMGPFRERTHRLEIWYYPKRAESAIAGSGSITDDREPPSGPRLAMVFDDFGYDMDIARRFIDEVDVPITLAVIPFLKYSVETVAAAKQKGHTAFLHLPMEPLDAGAMGGEREHFLTVSMDDAKLRARLNQALDSLPPVDGVNNHMGSRLTAEPIHMEIIIRELKKRGLPFLDSRTTPDSVGAETAANMGLPYASRDVFIDQGYLGGDVGANINQLMELARKDGSAIGIGHARKETLEILKDKIDDIEASGIEIVSVLDLMFFP